MFERFDENARNAFSLAGNLAARRQRRRTGEHFAQGVQITVADVQEALRIVVDAHGYQGNPTKALSARLAKLPAKGEITAEHLREVLK